MDVSLCAYLGWYSWSGMDTWMNTIMGVSWWIRANNEPTPLSLPGKSRGQRSLAGYSPRGRKELHTTEWLTFNNSFNEVKLGGTVSVWGSYLPSMAVGQILKPDSYFTKCSWWITEGKQRKREWMNQGLLLRNKYLKTCIVLKWLFQLRVENCFSASRQEEPSSVMLQRVQALQTMTKADGK